MTDSIKKDEETIILEPEKQKELYKIVEEAFRTELKVGNCFVLPLVIDKAGLLIREKGFEKVNKKTFLSAPLYFKVGYNQKNALAISLAGYPQDPTFSDKYNEDYVSVKTKTVEPLTQEQQKKLALIFVSTFKNHNRYGKVLLSQIGLVAGKKIEEAGFGRPTVELFQRANDYFTILPNNKGAHVVSLKVSCGITMMPFDKMTNNKNEKMVKEESYFIDKLFDHLKKEFRFNEISENDILKFIKQHQKEYKIPQSIGSEEKLLCLLREKYGSIVRDSGENTPKEKFIVLRKTMEIPKIVHEQVEQIVAECFLDREIVPNEEVGQALRDNNIKFKDYNFVDLTSFVRAFPDIFSYFVKQRPSGYGKKGVDIFVRIKPEFKIKYKDYEPNPQNHIFKFGEDSFTNKINELFKKGDYTTILNWSVLREALKFADAETWSYILKAYYSVNNIIVDNELTEWEKEVFNFEKLAANIAKNDYYLKKFNFDKEKENNIKLYIQNYVTKTLKFTILGKRMEALCGQNTELINAVYNLGLLARAGGDRQLCFMYLLLHYLHTNADDNAIYEIWDEYSNSCATNFNTSVLCEALFKKERFHCIERIALSFSKDSIPASAKLYSIYSKIMLGNETELLPQIDCIDNKNAVELVTTVLNYAVKEGNTVLFVKMLFACLNKPGQYIDIENLEDWLSIHIYYLHHIYKELIEEAKAQKHIYLVVLQYFFDKKLLVPTEEWEYVYSECKEAYIEKTKSAGTAEKDKVLYSAIELFPTESVFTNELVNYVMGDNKTDNLEEIINDLYRHGKYKQIIMLYEHKNKTDLNLYDKPWFLNVLCSCYKKQNELKKALAIEALLIQQGLAKNENVDSSFYVLIDILYDGLISKKLISLNIDFANDLTKLFYNFHCLDNKIRHKCCISLMGLAVCDKNIPLLSLLYCFTQDTDYEREFLMSCEEAIKEFENGYQFRIHDLQKTYEYLLTHETPEVIFNTLRLTGNVIAVKSGVSFYKKAKFKDFNFINNDTNSFVSFLILENNNERTWQLLSWYTNKYNRIHLNYVANAVLLSKFSSMRYALKTCIDANINSVDSNLPYNFLAFNQLIWNKLSRQSMEDYYQSFFWHICKRKTFLNANIETVNGFYKMLLSKTKLFKIDFLLALEIAKQSNTFTLFCKHFIIENAEYRTLVENDIGLFVNFCAAFSHYADKDAMLQCFAVIKQMRARIDGKIIGESERNAFLWVDELFGRRNRLKLFSDSFIKASMEILSSYPNEPVKNGKFLEWFTSDSKNKLPDYHLLKNWLNTFPKIENVMFAELSFLDKYLRHNYLPADKNERNLFYKIYCLLTEKHILFFKSDHQINKYDYFRRCRTYYTLKKLLKDDQPMPSSFKEKMQIELNEQHFLKAYSEYENSVDKFINAVHSDFVKEMFLYCGGISNYWDVCLEQCLKLSNDIEKYKSEINQFLVNVDNYKLRRRLLQMYTYSEAAHISVITQDSEMLGLLAKQKDVKNYLERVNKQDLDYQEYHSQLITLIKLLQPSLLVIIDFIEKEEITDEKIRLIQSLGIVLLNKNYKVLQTKISAINKKSMANVVIPTMCAVQYNENLKAMLLNMSFNRVNKALELLENRFLENVIGAYEVHLFKCLYFTRIKDFVNASNEFTCIGLRNNVYGDLYDKLQMAIRNETEVELNEDELGIDFQGYKFLPDFTYAKREDAGGDDFQQLVADFYTANLYDAKGKCQLAKKIFSLLEDGAVYSDSIKFMFDWGFAEIEATTDIEKKVQILCELTEKIDQLNDYQLLKNFFVKNYVYLLQEVDFTFLIRNANKFISCYKVLYRKFKPFDDCHCYAQLLELLSELIALSKDIGKDPNDAKIEAGKIAAHIKNVRKNYPQNRFANKTEDYIDRFIQQIFQSGVFEVRILNKDNIFNDVIFYQIKNIGFEIVTGVTLTLAIEGYPETIEGVKIDKIIPAGLRPEQIYAAEYIPKLYNCKDDIINCTVTVEYPVKDESGNIINKNYIAVDSHNGGTLKVVENASVEYKKRIGAGYISPIDNNLFFVGRKSDLESILGHVFNGQSVVLYGTNGTGKSSILNILKNICLPMAYEKDAKRYDKYIFAKNLDYDDMLDMLGEYYYAPKEITYQKDCTEKQFYDSLIRKVSVEDDSFKSFIEAYATNESVNTITKALNRWNDCLKDDSNIKAFDVEGNCINPFCISNYFESLDHALQISDIDLYIFIDQFERVISSSHIDSNHMLFFRDFKCDKIRFIVAGSNYLLEEVSVDKRHNNQKDSWPDIFARGVFKDGNIKIGNMEENDFKLLMNQSKALNNGEIEYMPEAIDFLWQFTKGHALYSSLIGNRILDILNKRKVRRKIIYPSDIFIAIYLSDKYITGTEAKAKDEKTFKDSIFQDIMGNTPVKYTGKALALMQARGDRKVSYQKLRSYIEEQRPDILKYYSDALAVLLARDFISYSKIELVQNDNTEMQNEIDPKTAREYYFTSDLYLEHFATVFVPELDDKERKALLDKNRSIDEFITELNTRKYSVNDIERLRTEAERIVGKIGNTYNEVHIGKQYNDRAVDQSTNIQINAQTINAAFNTLLGSVSDSKILTKAFQQLPTLSLYIGQEHKQLIEMRKKELEQDYAEYEDCFNEEGICQNVELCKEISGRITEKEKEIQQITENAERPMLSDTLSAAGTDAFMNVGEERWKELLNIDNEDIKALKELPVECYTPLTFAIVLHNIFNNVYEKIHDREEKGEIKTKEISSDKMDFCPVAIMYCKVVEAMLKNLHTSRYIKALGDKTIDKGNPPKLFKDLGTPENYDLTKANLTIGAYTFHIVFLEDEKDVLNYKPIKKPVDTDFNFNKKWRGCTKIENIKALVGKNDNLKIEQWKKHAQCLKIVELIRNKSAHEATPISKELFDWLIETLFENRELFMITEVLKK